MLEGANNEDNRTAPKGGRLVPKGASVEKLDMLNLETDCYSIVLVLPGQFWLVPALFLPAFAAFFQVCFLFFVSSDHTNVFQEGRWLQPGSQHWYVYMLKGLSVLVTLLKCFTELNANMSLYVALRYGKFDGETRRCLGWCWWLLQYVVTIWVLVCAVSLVGSAQSAINCIFKSLAVALVVDLDNMLAAAIVTMTNIEFKVDVDPDLEPPPPPTQIQQRNELFPKPSCKWFFYMGFPIALALAEIFIAVWHNSLPLTILQMGGYVSNDFPPELRGDITGGCCSPMQVADSDDDPSTSNFTVLFFSRIEQPVHGAPLLHWVALESQPEPTPPSSYQVMLGVDGDGNPGHDHGVVVGAMVQAKYWLTDHGFDTDTYDALVTDVGLHQRVAPFAATLQVRKLLSYGHAYRIHVAGQNEMTRALSQAPLQSSLLLTSVCPDNCEKCETSKTCNKCVDGYYLLPRAVEKRTGVSCTKCIDNCDDCSKNAKKLMKKTGDLDVRHLAENGVPCDDAQCAKGYGKGNNTKCISCNVLNCATCEGNGTAVPGTCSTCGEGYGLRVNHTNGTVYTCDPCQHNCLSCNHSVGCAVCDTGFGLRGEEDNRTCVQCEEGCRDCQNSSTCATCKDAFVNTDGKCRECPKHCENCTLGGATECDECKEGYGLSGAQPRRCEECTVERCVRCDGVPAATMCTLCGQNYGLNNDNTSCARCGDSCTQCDKSGECAVCEAGYALKDVRAEDGSGLRLVCWPCGDGCHSCSKAGAGRCDVCLPGYEKSNASDASCYSANEREYQVPNLEV